MSATLPKPAAQRPVTGAEPPVAGALLRAGALPAHSLLRALERGGPQGLGGVLHPDRSGTTALRRRLAAEWGLGAVNPHRDPPDVRLVDRMGAVACLSDGLMPWRQVAGVTLVGTADPARFDLHRPRLTSLFGPVTPVLCLPGEAEAAITRLRGPSLVTRAETSVLPDESCRDYHPARLLPALAVAGLLTALGLATSPALLLVGLTLVALGSMIGFTGLKIAAWIAMQRPEPPLPDIAIARLPVVSLIVALYRESNIAHRLVSRLRRLDYPQDRLEVVLAVEADDTLTRVALARADLPPWMRIVVVPGGSVRTKPRALNYALNHCRGSLIGVYDAEDAPEPDQIRRMVTHFHARGPDVACLQGALDFYNPGQNWLSRCFTVEYAAWFRLLLPGIARLGLPVPLGGTTLFFRRSALERLGRWDAHNVTEDADLGLRLARHGYRTEILASTTFEEANCRARPWVRQRSRWIKGFMMTWLTHMRSPRALWRDLGPRRFWAVQLLLLGSVTHALTAPLLWSLWLVAFGLPHPVASLLGPLGFDLLGGLFVLTALLGMGFGIAGLRRAGRPISPLWVPTLAFYNPMATAAAWKAAAEMVTRPFWWDKTRHGLSEGDSPPGP